MAGRAYRLGRATRALTPTGGFLKGFAFSLNPYIGCAFGDAGGCPFCYVRMLPVARVEQGAWGSWVIAKSNLAELLARELRALAQAGKLASAAIFMSSATDPYQGIERKLRLTRAALEQFAACPPRRVLVQTRSPLVERDIDLLKVLGAHALVSLTLETDDEPVRRALTPTSPAVARRLLTARRLREAGIFVQLAISPMLPNNAARFAELADSAADRVIVDTYFDGDGSGGRRSRALGMEQIYARHGYQGWFRPGAEADLVAALRARLGEQRVLLSREGFSAV
ncbi:MAG TPA: radical SAM protein [Candidatus Binataceae bacterium]|nr:radical SAM protein [Candidatus Binataceae bacterium]